MIEVKQMTKSYDKPVLEDLDLIIPTGSIFGLVGINGAGKSTMLKLLSGILKPEKGEIFFDGESVFENERIKKEIFFLPDEPFYSRNTTPKNLPDLYKAFYDLDMVAYQQYISLFQIPERKTMYSFSKGMKRQVFCALALAIRPKYLFLDEAFDGLDPLARLALKREMLRIQEENDMTIVISSHSLRELEDICDSYALIDGKKISTSGDMSDTSMKYHKYRMAFQMEPKEDDFKGIEIKRYIQDKRIVTMVVQEDYEEFSKKIAPYQPLIIDEIAIDFEELFIIEVESRGYMR